MKSTSPVAIKPFKVTSIDEDIHSASNDTLREMINHKSYDFCVNQDLEDDSVFEAARRLEMLYLEALNRIFIFNGHNDVAPFKVYETVDMLFNEHGRYNCNKSISGLRRINTWGRVIDPEANEEKNAKYVGWLKARIKFASRVLNDKLDFISM